MNHKQIPPRPGTTALLEPVENAPATTDATGSGDEADREHRALHAQVVVRRSRRAHPSTRIGRDQRERSHEVGRSGRSAPRWSAPRVDASARWSPHHVHSTTERLPCGQTLPQAERRGPLQAQRTEGKGDEQQERAETNTTRDT